jgi:hypothetical protein
MSSLLVGQDDILSYLCQIFGKQVKSVRKVEKDRML